MHSKPRGPLPIDAAMTALYTPDAEQMPSDEEQTASGSDQMSTSVDQLASDRDQAAADRHGIPRVDGEVHDDLFELTGVFNQFYNRHRVLGSGEAEAARLLLVECVRMVLAQGLKLLAVKPLERM